MQIIGINENNVELFGGMFTEVQKLEIIIGNSLFALGIIEDNKAVGEIIIRLEGQAVIIDSIYIEPKFRRRGFATELVLNAADYATGLDTFFGMKASFKEEDEYGEDLKGFFEYLEFDLVELGGPKTYLVNIDDIDTKRLDKKIDGIHVKTIRKLSKYELNQIYDEAVKINPEEVNGEPIEKDISLFITGKDSIDAIILFSERDGALTIEWTRVSEKHSKYLIVLLREALSRITSKYGSGTDIYIPVLNNKSDKIVKALFGNKAKIVEKKWEATFEFDYDIIDE